MAKGKSERESDPPCPHCGAPLARGAKSCRACGASGDSGWNNDALGEEEFATGGYGEEDDFDYQEYLRREFPGDGSGVAPPRDYKRWILAAILAMVLLGMVLSSFTGPW